jgi:hypothetical protein
MKILRTGTADGEQTRLRETNGRYVLEHTTRALPDEWLVYEVPADGTWACFDRRTDAERAFDVLCRDGLERGPHGGDDLLAILATCAIPPDPAWLDPGSWE